MALPPLADATALAQWLGVTFSEDDTERAEAVLAAASAVVRAGSGELYVDEEGELVDPLPDAVPVVTVQVAAKMWANPAGVTQETRGPFSVTYDLDALTDDQRTLVSSGHVSGLSSIQVVAPLETRLDYRPSWWEEEDEE